MKRSMLIAALTLGILGGCDEYDGEIVPNDEFDKIADTEENELRQLEVDAVDTGENEPRQLEVDGPDASAEANSGSHLNSCRWRRARRSTSYTVQAYCRWNEKPISGGCFHEDSSIDMVRSHPFEVSTFNNLPDHGELWYATDGGTGWRCKFSGVNQAEWAWAVALCCG